MKVGTVGAGRVNGGTASHPNDETSVLPPPRLAHVKNGESPPHDSIRMEIALVAGSTPHLSAETRDLLRSRLRIVASLLFACFLAYIVRWVSHWSEWNDPIHHLLFSILGVVAVVLGLLTLALCHKSTFSLTKLRIAEILVFGAPALFFLALHYFTVLQDIYLPEGRGYLPYFGAPWMLLIFTYAMFIPNTWQRAIAVMAAIGAAPIAVSAYFWFSSAAFRRLTEWPDLAGYMSGQALYMCAAVLIGAIGVRRIGTLRREAFTARQLGQYRLKQRLGSGGMGEVYLAEHRLLKRPCVVKVIHPEKAGDPRTLARFEREVCATAKLSHWNSIEIYDYGHTADGTFYYVMEFLPGHNLNEMMVRYGPFPAGRVVYLMDQICAALAEAHGIGLVHRDIKPANIFCAYRGGIFDVAKLLDFGLVKPLSEKVDAHLTQEGSIAGSPLFMSPEQATGDDRVDGRSDIYSLGAVMYYMLTSQPPFAYENPVKAIIAHASEAVVPPRQVNLDVPDGLDEVIMRCLEKDPEDRFQDVTALQRALRDVKLAEPWSSELAAQWWSCNGCPERKKLAAALVEAAAV